MRIVFCLAIILMWCCVVTAPPVFATAAPSSKAPGAAYEGWDVSGIRPGEVPYKIIFFGDSILSGYGLANPETKIFNLIINNLGKEYYVSRGMLLRNMSQEGETSSSALKRVKQVIALQPDIVVMSIGMNDALYGTDPDILYNNLETVVLDLNRAGIYVLFTGMQATTKNGYDYLSKFNTVYAKIAHKYPVVFLPNLMQGVSGNRLLLQHDGYYPNQDGAKVIANSIMVRLTDMFKQYDRYKAHIDEIKMRQKFMQSQNRGSAGLGQAPMFTQEQIDAIAKQPMPFAR
jgi:acyl-CoA thioesterase I